MTQSTLGFRKYPSTRNIAPRTTQRWLEGKRIDDDIGSPELWRVHNDLYDLTDFIEHHPGGADWLRITRGTDITEAFEAHHPNIAVAHAVLRKYRVREATTPRNSPFTFEPDGFYATFRSRAWPIIQALRKGGANDAKNASSITSPSMRHVTDTLAASFVVLMVLACVTGAYSSWLSRVLTLAAGGALALATISAHNFFHQADNWRMYVFDLSLLSSYDWRISHALSHHIFPNTVYDVEISALEPMLCFLPTPKTPLQRYGVWLYSLLLYAILLPVQFLAKCLVAVRARVAPVAGQPPPLPLRPENALPFVELALCIVLCGSLSAGLGTWLLMHLACSWLFAFVGLIAAHHHPDLWHDGDDPKYESRDWGIQQIAAARDRVDVSGRLWLVATMFGDHTLHHLLPTIDHAMLPALYPVLQQTCREFNVDCQQSDILTMAIGKYRQYAKVTPTRNTKPPCG